MYKEFLDMFPPKIAKLMNSDLTHLPVHTVSLLDLCDNYCEPAMRQILEIYIESSNFPLNA